MSLADYQVILPYFNSGSIFCHIDLDLVFNLSPYFHFKKEATDTHPVLLIHKKRQTGSKYLFEVLSYSQQIELPREEFEDRDNDLRNLTI